MKFDLHSKVILSTPRPSIKDKRASKRGYKKRYSCFDLTSDCPALHNHKKFSIWFQVGDMTGGQNSFLAHACGLLTWIRRKDTTKEVC